ncbi:hypothetical protein A0H81_00343 [Grifola frondosa]|uniref:Uncharacterized protein n=1 Tax=Grifola frondosa TaxID=5627 RepID=A0A1C7MPX2_GRIFR|nr:hypothetical protein A0H81_00343 [Grifola frondosa]
MVKTPSTQSLKYQDRHPSEVALQQKPAKKSLAAPVARLGPETREQGGEEADRARYLPPASAQGKRPRAGPSGTSLAA